MIAAPIAPTVVPGWGRILVDENDEGTERNVGGIGLHHAAGEACRTEAQILAFL